MPLSPLPSVRAVVAFATAVVVSALLSGGEVDAGNRTRAPSCAQADIHSIQLAAPTAIDGVRVVVARRSPVGGAALVRVDAGDTDRVVHVRGAISKELAFSPAITASELEISLDPVFTAKRGACVERIELLSNGRPVASVKPD